MLYWIMRQSNNRTQKLLELQYMTACVVDEDLQSLEGLPKYFTVLPIIQLRYNTDNLELAGSYTLVCFDEQPK